MNRTLILDIETSPIVAYVWGLKDQNVGLSQIKKDWAVLAWSAKWLGDPPSKIIYMDSRREKDYANDKRILLPLWKLLDAADIVITQNGQYFDAPKLNARFIFHGMKPPSPYKHFDTYQLVKRVASFTSNKLEYLTSKLCTTYKKESHKKFPGMALWDACMNRNVQAWDEMKRYNIMDVLSTEEFYMKIRAWAPERFPKPYQTDAVKNCGTCGKGPLQKRGLNINKKVRRQRLQCRACGAWQTGEIIK